MKVTEMTRNQKSWYNAGMAGYVNFSGDYSLDEMANSLQARGKTSDEVTAYRQGWEQAKADMTIEVALTLSREHCDQGD